MASLGTCGNHLVSRSIVLVLRRGYNDVEINLDQRGLGRFMVEVLPILPPYEEEIVVGLKVEGRGPVTQLDARVRKVFGIFLVIFPLLGLA